MRGPDADVVVVGAGPAGSAAAAQLAAFGLRVVILERARFPRPRIGESLPPKVESLFRILGVQAEVAAAGFARMRGTVVSQGAGRDRAYHPFDPEGGRRGYQVDRARLDALLLARAQALGAQLCEGAAAELGWDGPHRVVRRRDGGALTARFVVDASGAAGWGARALGLRRREAVRTVALAGYWAHARLPDDFEATATLFEMLPDGWIWSLLRQDGLRNVTLGLDAAQVKDPAVLPEALYLERVRASELVGPLLTPARQAGPLTAHDATWIRAERFVEDGVLFAGDAAATIDPLTSQGVYKALRSGVVAASVVNTALHRPKDAALALDHYAEVQAELADAYGAVARTFYRASPYADAPFWRTRIRADAAAPDALGDAAAEAGVARRAELRRLAMEAGGQRLRLGAAPGLSLERRAALRGPFVELTPALVFAGRAVDLGGLDPQALLPLLDDRPMAEVFDRYAAAVGAGPSAPLGRQLMRGLLNLVERGALTTRVAPPGRAR